MAAFSTVSFFQLTFIPGFILLKLIGFKKTGFAGTALYSFALSLIINYLLVLHLTLAGIYTPMASYLILGIELVLILCLALKKKIKVTDELYISINTDFKSFPKNIIPIAALAATVGSLYFFFASYGDVFTHWDAVFSWNRWAIDWYLNDIPQLTYLYPQLIPANWSLSYIMMKDHTLQFAAKSIMPLFNTFIMVAFFDLYLKKQKKVFLLSILFFSAAVLLYSLPYIDSGYVDFASALMSAAAFHAILRTDSSNPGLKDTAMVFLLASGAAASKQSGLIILSFSIFWFIWIIVKNRKPMGFKNVLLNISLAVFIILFVLYWYIIKLVDIIMGRDFSTLQFLFIDIHHDASLLQRFINGLEILRENPVFFLILIVLSIISLSDRKSRWFTLGITIPSVLLWGFLFSYDDRNIIQAFPFLAFSASSAVVFLFRKINITGFFRYRIPVLFKTKAEPKKIRLWPKYIFILIFLLPVIGLTFTAGVFDTSIRSNQIQKQKQIGESDLNMLLYEYSKENEIDGKIITDYYWITVLPGFEDETKKIFLENKKFIILSNSDSYELVNPNELADNNTYGFLISDMYYKDRSFKNEFESNLEKGNYTLKFSCDGYHFIKINN
jgi:hypothetical protein